MKLIKYDNFWNDPFEDLGTTMRQIFGDRLSLPGLFSDEFGHVLDRSFRVDTFVNDDAYRVVAELPGIPKEAIDVKLENAILTIHAEHKTGKGDSERTLRFSRSITVGDGINGDKVEASLENGLLTITLPKVEERKPRAITVK